MKVWGGVILISTFLLGCAGKLRPDPVPVSAIDANYPTAEIVVEGERVNGLGVLEVPSGTDLSSITIGLQGYHKGTFTVNSSICDVDEKFRYDGFKLHRVDLSGVFKESCFLDVVASHEWPKESSSGLKISAVKGRIWLISSPNKVFTKISKAKDGVGDSLFIASPSKEVRVVFRGCSSAYDRKVDTFEGFAEVPLSDVVGLSPGLRCGLVGAAIDASQSLKLYWMAWVYGEDFTPLPEPSIKINEDVLEVDGDPGVSIIALDNEFEVDFEASFKDVDWSKPHVLRLITVKGRLMVGEWIPEKKEWVWKP